MWIYRGSAYAYANDPDFSGINNTIDYWQSVIDQYYSKYTGIYKTHLEFIKQVSLTGQITSPFGRVHKFTPKHT
jgi:acyl-ACP thioesterase